MARDRQKRAAFSKEQESKTFAAAIQGRGGAKASPRARFRCWSAAFDPQKASGIPGVERRAALLAVNPIEGFTPLLLGTIAHNADAVVRVAGGRIAFRVGQTDQ